MNSLGPGTSQCLSLQSRPVLQTRKRQERTHVPHQDEEHPDNTSQSNDYGHDVQNTSSCICSSDNSNNSNKRKTTIVMITIAIVFLAMVNIVLRLILVIVVLIVIIIIIV